MAGITHTFVSAVAQGGDDTLVRKDDWNAEHSITYPITIGPLIFDAGAVSISGGAEINFVDSKLICKDCHVTGDLNHALNKKIGFFGGAPVTKTEVADLIAPTATGGGEGATAATVATVNAALAEITTKINALLDALQSYGLV